MFKNQRGFASQLLIVLLLVAGVGLGTYLVGQKTNLLPKAAESTTPSYYVQPYLVYPADQSQYPSDPNKLVDALKEVQSFYLKQTGKTFNLAELKIVQSKQSYAEMKCNPDDPNDCSVDPAILKSNFIKNTTKAIWGTSVITPSTNSLPLIFSAGGGSLSDGSNAQQAYLGDYFIEALTGQENSWGIPCKTEPQTSNCNDKNSYLGGLIDLINFEFTGSPDLAAAKIFNYPDGNIDGSIIEKLKASPFFIDPNATAAAPADPGNGNAAPANAPAGGTQTTQTGGNGTAPDAICGVVKETGENIFCYRIGYFDSKELLAKTQADAKTAANNYENYKAIMKGISQYLDPATNTFTQQLIDKGSADLQKACSANASTTNSATSTQSTQTNTNPTGCASTKRQGTCPAGQKQTCTTQPDPGVKGNCKIDTCGPCSPSS